MFFYKNRDHELSFVASTDRQTDYNFNKIYDWQFSKV